MSACVCYRCDQYFDSAMVNTSLIKLVVVFVFCALLCDQQIGSQFIAIPDSVHFLILLLSTVVGIITDFLFSIHTYNYGRPLGLFLSLSFPTTQIEKKSISRVPFEKIVLPRSRGYCVTELVGSVCTAYNFHRVKMLVRIME